MGCNGARARCLAFEDPMSRRTAIFVVTALLLGPVPRAAKARSHALSQEQAVKRAVGRHPAVDASKMAARAALTA